MLLSVPLFTLFLLTSFANILSPGAGAVMAVTTAIEGGVSGSNACRLGLAAGIATVMSASVAGLGVIVSGHPAVYDALRIAGACYLVYLGVRAWRAPAAPIAGEGSAARGSAGLRQFAEGYWLQVSNPQPLVFSVSILPQFIDPSLAYAPQAVIMTAVYAVMVFVIMTGYSWAASEAASFFKSPRASLWLRRSSASVFFLIAAVIAWTLLRS